MPLYNQTEIISFPKESDGTKKIRYPSNVYASNAPASSALVANTASIVPFYLDSGANGFSAISGALGNSTGGPWGIKVAVYSANTGLSTASLIESVNLSISGVPSPRTATFVGAGSNLGKGWYILSAFWDGTGGTINNSGNWSVANQPVIGTIGVSPSPSGSYAPSNYKITGLTSFQPLLTGAALFINVADCPYFFPYY